MACDELGIPGLDNINTGGCKPVVKYEPSETLDISGDGSTCEPLKIELKDGIIQPSSDGWSITGNTITEGMFLGSNNNQNLVFKRNGVEVAKFYDGAAFITGGTGQLSVTGGWSQLKAGEGNYFQVTNSYSSMQNTSDEGEASLRLDPTQARIIINDSSLFLDSGFRISLESESGEALLDLGPDSFTVEMDSENGSAYINLQPNDFRILYENGSAQLIFGREAFWVGVSTNEEDYTEFRVTPTGTTIETLSGSGTRYVTADEDGLLSTATIPAGFDGWSLTGNTGTNSGVNFIGTLDEADLVLKSGGVEITRIGTEEVTTVLQKSEEVEGPDGPVNFDTDSSVYQSADKIQVSVGASTTMDESEYSLTTKLLIQNNFEDIESNGIELSIKTEGPVGLPFGDTSLKLAPLNGIRMESGNGVATLDNEEFKINYNVEYESASVENEFILSDNGFSVETSYHEEGLSTEAELSLDPANLSVGFSRDEDLTSTDLNIGSGYLSLFTERDGENIQVEMSPDEILIYKDYVHQWEDEEPERIPFVKFSGDETEIQYSKLDEENGEIYNSNFQFEEDRASFSINYENVNDEYSDYGYYGFNQNSFDIQMSSGSDGSSGNYWFSCGNFSFSADGVEEEVSGSSSIDAKYSPNDEFGEEYLKHIRLKVGSENDSTQLQVNNDKIQLFRNFAFGDGVDNTSYFDINHEGMNYSLIDENYETSLGVWTDGMLISTYKSATGSFQNFQLSQWAQRMRSEVKAEDNINTGTNVINLIENSLEGYLEISHMNTSATPNTRSELRLDDEYAMLAVSRLSENEISVLLDDERIFMRTPKVGLGMEDPTARLHIQAGSTAAGTAPIKIEEGPLMDEEEPGALEYDGQHLYFTEGGFRKRIFNYRVSDFAGNGWGDIVSNNNGAIVLDYSRTAGNKFKVVQSQIEQGSPLLVWDAVNELFISIGTASSPAVQYSSDGETWTQGVIGATNTWTCMATGNGYTVAMSNTGTNNRCMYSTDGVNWSLGNTTGLNNAYSKIIYVPGTTSTFLAFYGAATIVKSTDGGQNWVALSNVLPATFGPAVSSIVATPTGTLCAVSGSGTVRACFSLDNGNTWSVSTHAGGPSLGKVVCTASGVLVCSSSLSGTFYYSYDDGASFVPQSYEQSFSSNGGLIWLGGESLMAFTSAAGFYDWVLVTFDAGATWTKIKLPKSVINNSGEAAAVGMVGGSPVFVTAAGTTTAKAMVVSEFLKVV